MAPVTYRGGLHGHLHLLSNDEDGKVYEDDVYNGVDPATGQPVTIAKGQTEEVSAEMAAYLAATFPHCFDVDGVKAKPKARGKKKTDADADADAKAKLLEHSRDELNAAAAELGIEDAEALDSDEAVADAILAKIAEAA